MRPESPHYYPGTLGNKPVAVQFHAGSHYVALRLLSGYLPEEKIKLVHHGSPQFRFEAMMRGEVEAAALMEPWITLAEKLGCRPSARDTTSAPRTPATTWTRTRSPPSTAHSQGGGPD